MTDPKNSEDQELGLDQLKDMTGGLPPRFRVNPTAWPLSRSFPLPEFGNFLADLKSIDSIISSVEKSTEKIKSTIASTIASLNQSDDQVN